MGETCYYVKSYAHYARHTQLKRSGQFVGRTVPMDETGVLGLLEELSILLEDSKPVLGKNNRRQVDINA